MRKLLRIMIFVVGLLSVFSSTLSAQETLSITPTQLTLYGIQGQSLTRSMVIQSATALPGLNLVPLELVSAEGHVLIPSVGNGVALPTDLADEVPLSIPLQVDLDGAKAGIYTGEALITYTGGSRSIPIQVQVKAQSWLPLLALVAGVALGVGVSSYRAKGRPRDEVMVRLGQLRTQMKVDEELQTLGRPFYDRLNAELVDVEAALEAQQWEQAETAAEEAASVWTRWRRGRPDWIVQFTAYTDFVTWLTGTHGGGRYVAELEQAARDICRTTPDLDGPQTLRAQMLPLTDRANTFMALQARIDTLAALSTHGTAQAAAYRQQLILQSPLDSAAGQALETLTKSVEAAITKLRKADLIAMLTHYQNLTEDSQAESVEIYRTRIDTLPPNADMVYLELRADLAADIQAATDREGLLEHAEAIRFSGEDAVSKGLTEVSPLHLITGLPQVRVQSLEEETLAAGRRLRWFTWVTYGVAVLLLALAGFVELYSTQPDFGAKGVTDYFTLLAWGFGAEATRSAVADMIQSWGVVRQ